MKHVFAAVVVLWCGSVAYAQSSKDPVTSVVKEILPRQQKNLVAAVEEMPADKFSFKPTPAQQTFGHLVAHMVEANNVLCSTLGGVAEPKTAAKESDGKDKLVAALKASFDLCDTALSKATDANLGEEIELWGGHKGSRAFALFALTNDWADHYSTAAMYLRLSGLLPPTAQGKK